MAYLLLFLFLATAVSAFAFKDIKRVRTASFVLGFASAAATGIFFANPLFTGRVFEMMPFLRIDRFSAFIGMLIVLLYFFANIVSYHYIGEEYEEGVLGEREARWYFFLLPVFAVAMLAVVSADNLGLLWLALETTTLATTPLVAIYKKEGSLEAAWKYIILCSLGISLGLLGVLLMSYAGENAGLSVFDSLSLRALAENASNMQTSIVRWAFLFTFIGLGTKVGFFPLHTWLPDAHGRTPSPISAVLSGILLNVALYALLKIKFITDLAIGNDGWTGGVFLFFGTLSVVASVFFLYIQHHYKRMLAYSSVEHMGILAIAVGLGPAGLVAAMMHMLAHAFSKSALFFGSGEILLYKKTGKIDAIKNLFGEMPLTTSFFTLALLSLLAAPPFAAFASEIFIVSALMKQERYLVLVILLASLSVICASLFKHVFRMFAIESEEVAQKAKREKWNFTHVVMILEIALLAAAGVFMFTQSGYEFFSYIAESLSLPL